MRGELLTKGYAVDMVAVNVITGADTVGELVSRCRYPVFQDVADVSAWEAHDGLKDDLFIYGADGTLAHYLPANGEVSTNLSTAIGYEYVRTLLTDMASKVP